MSGMGDTLIQIRINEINTRIEELEMIGQLLPKRAPSKRRTKAKPISKKNTYNKAQRLYELELEFLKEKRIFMSRISNLPFAIAFQYMNSSDWDQLKEIKGISLLSEYQVKCLYIKSLKMESLMKFIQTAKNSTPYMKFKGSIMSDVKLVLELLDIHKQKVELQHQRRNVTTLLTFSSEEIKMLNQSGEIQEGENTYKKETLRKYQKELEAYMLKLSMSYDYIIKGINTTSLLQSIKTTGVLSEEFIRQHMAEVASYDPTILRKQKECNKSIFAFIRKRRKKKFFKEFLETLQKYYHSEKPLELFEIYGRSFSELSEQELEQIKNLYWKKLSVAQSLKIKIEIALQSLDEEEEKLAIKLQQKKEKMKKELKIRLDYVEDEYVDRLFEESNLKRALFDADFQREAENLIAILEMNYYEKKPNYQSKDIVKTLGTIPIAH